MGDFGTTLDRILRDREMTNVDLAAKIPSPRKAGSYTPGHFSRLRRGLTSPSPHLLGELERVLGPDAGYALRLAWDEENTPALAKEELRKLRAQAEDWPKPQTPEDRAAFLSLMAMLKAALWLLRPLNSYAARILEAAEVRGDNGQGRFPPASQ